MGERERRTRDGQARTRSLLLGLGGLLPLRALVLLVRARLEKRLVRRLLLFLAGDLTGLDAERRLRDGDDLLEGVLCNVLELRARSVTLDAERRLRDGDDL